jgi:hypothetical protein
MKPIGTILVAVTMMCASGCTTPPDWIERTLVTVDVTGLWSGQSLGAIAAGGTFAELYLDLQQDGPKVKGFLRGIAPVGHSADPIAGPVEGRVAGDVFTFRQTNGPMSGTLTVRGDEMAGNVFVPRPLPMIVRRTDSSSRPSSPKP